MFEIVKHFQILLYLCKNMKKLTARCTITSSHKNMENMATQRNAVPQVSTNFVKHHFHIQKPFFNLLTKAKCKLLRPFLTRVSTYLVSAAARAWIEPIIAWVFTSYIIIIERGYMQSIWIRSMHEYVLWVCSNAWDHDFYISSAGAQRSLCQDGEQSQTLSFIVVLAKNIVN